MTLYWNSTNHKVLRLLVYSDFPNKVKVDYIPISALQHFLFCRRQCALIHIEQQWAENRLTAEGEQLHRSVHETDFRKHKEVRFEHSVALVSERLKIIGKADMVEWRQKEGHSSRVPFPVEFKHGKPKVNDCDRVQLCAQALCLEEMVGVKVEEGAIYYGTTHRRTLVVFDTALRNTTEALCREVYEFLFAGTTPPPLYGKHCHSCSLVDICCPLLKKHAYPVQEYLNRMIMD